MRPLPFEGAGFSTHRPEISRPSMGRHRTSPRWCVPPQSRQAAHLFSGILLALFLPARDRMGKPLGLSLLSPIPGDVGPAGGCLGCRRDVFYISVLARET